MSADEHLFWADLAFSYLWENGSAKCANDHICNCRLSQLCSVSIIYNVSFILGGVGHKR